MAKSTQEIPIKFYDITIDASDFENDVMRLFGELRPQWTREEMKNEVGVIFFANHRRLNWLLNRLFRRRSKKTSKLRVTELCEGKSPITGEFPHKGPVRQKSFRLVTSSWTSLAWYVNQLVGDLLACRHRTMAVLSALMAYCEGNHPSQVIAHTNSQLYGALIFSF